MTEERLFEPYFDPVDMTALCPADITEAGFRERFPEAACYFPLFADATAPLCEQVARIEYAARSARYGGYADNILGMNWELPNGDVVRVGERVVKCSTGYDLMRFLLHAPETFGRPKDYVLRLRAPCESDYEVAVTGAFAPLDDFRRALLRSPWMHVIDAVDWVWADGANHIRVTADIMERNRADYAAYFQGLAETHGVDCGEAVPLPAALGEVSKVSAAVKLTPGESARVAREIHEQKGFPLRCHLASGYVVVFADASGEGLSAADLASLHERAVALGGHVRSIHLSPAPRPDDAAADELLKSWLRKLSGQAA